MTVVVCLTCGADKPCDCDAATLATKVAALESENLALRRVITHAQVTCNAQVEELRRLRRVVGGSTQ